MDRTTEWQDTTKNFMEDETEMNLRIFANLAGFPIDFIKKELFPKRRFKDKDPVTMMELRSAMIKYLDETLLDSR